MQMFQEHLLKELRLNGNQSIKATSKRAWAGKQSNGERHHNKEETASQILCDSQALTESQFHHLESCFMKPADYHMAPLRKLSHFIPGEGLTQKGIQNKIAHGCSISIVNNSPYSFNCNGVQPLSP